MKAKSEKFYKDRADFIVELFKLLTNYYSSVYHITEIKANVGNLKDIINNYDNNKASHKKALEDLNNYYAPNRIYLTKNLASIVFQFYNSIFTSFKEYIKLLNSTDNEKIEKLNQITETIGNVKHKELDDILERFREILYPESELTTHFSTDKDDTKETQS